MVKNFKGKVHISDVQEEFDALVGGVNEIIDAYNSADFIQDIDYSDVSPDIGAYGYTLSVGALKKILSTYDGCVLGAHVFDNNDGTYTVTNGLYLSANGGIPLPSGVVNAEDGKSTLYYDTVQKVYKFGTKGNSYTTFSIPALTSNTSWGVCSATVNNTNAYLAFDQNSGTSWDIPNTELGSSSRLSFTFSKPMKISQITVTINQIHNSQDLWNGDFYHIERINIYTSDGVLLGSETYDRATGGVISRQLNTDGNTVINGIYLDVFPFNTTYQYQSKGRVVDVSLVGQIKNENPTGESDPENLIKIRKINGDRNMAISDSEEFIAEKVGDSHILCGAWGGDVESTQYPNPNISQFVSAVTPNYTTTGNPHLLLFGQDVGFSAPTGGNHTSFTLIPRLFLPKGCANPFTLQWWKNKQYIMPYYFKKN